MTEGSQFNAGGVLDLALTELITLRLIDDPKEPESFLGPRDRRNKRGGG